MRHPKELIEKMESYSVKIGLDPRLVHFARSEEQADELIEIQLHYVSIYPVKEPSTYSNDPKKLREATLKKISELRSVLYEHYPHIWVDDLLSQGLQTIKEQVAAANPILDGESLKAATNDIEQRLSDVKFSNTTIKKLLPILREIIKTREVF